MTTVLKLMGRVIVGYLIMVHYAIPRFQLPTLSHRISDDFVH